MRERGRKVVEEGEGAFTKEHCIFIDLSKFNYSEVEKVYERICKGFWKQILIKSLTLNNKMLNFT